MVVGLLMVSFSPIGPLGAFGISGICYAYMRFAIMDIRATLEKEDEDEDQIIIP